MYSAFQAAQEVDILGCSVSPMWLEAATQFASRPVVKAAFVGLAVVDLVAVVVVVAVAVAVAVVVVVVAAAAAVPAVAISGLGPRCAVGNGKTPSETPKPQPPRPLSSSSRVQRGSRRLWASRHRTPPEVQV